MISSRNSIIGKKSGKLTVVGIAPTPSHIKNPKTIYVYCNCECGNKNVLKRYNNVASGLTISCGCEYHKVGKKYKDNKFEEKDNYYIGIDGNNNKFYFSKEDYDKVSKLTWYVNEARNNEVINGKDEIKMHRFIMNVTDSKLDVDHINHNRNDNRRENLRIVTPQNNNRNIGLSKNNTSGVIGVSKTKNNKWCASITINYKTIHLGTFSDFNDALKARKKAEEKYFGEYSYDNSQIIANKNKIKEII